MGLDLGKHWDVAKGGLIICYIKIMHTKPS